MTYTVKCKKCGAVKKTNYQQYKKKEEAGTLKKHTCRKCQDKVRKAKKQVAKKTHAKTKKK